MLEVGQQTPQSPQQSRSGAPTPQIASDLTQITLPRGSGANRGTFSKEAPVASSGGAETTGLLSPCSRGHRDFPTLCINPCGRRSLKHPQGWGSQLGASTGSPPRRVAGAGGGFRAVLGPQGAPGDTGGGKGLSWVPRSPQGILGPGQAMGRESSSPCVHSARFAGQGTDAC